MECPVCRELYDAGARRPMALVPCGHSCCETCMAGHRVRQRSTAVVHGTNPTVTCPFCRETVTTTGMYRAHFHLIEHNEGATLISEHFRDMMCTVSCFCPPVVNRGILDFIDEMKTKETGGTEGKIRLCTAVTCRSASGHAPTSRAGFVLCVISESNVIKLSSHMSSHA